MAKKEVVEEEPEVIYDPVDTAAYPERPFEEAVMREADHDPTHGFLRYEDPEHHRNGNMTTVDIPLDDPVLGEQPPALPEQQPVSDDVPTTGAPEIVVPHSE